MYLSGLWAAHSTASLHTHIVLTNLTRPTKLFATQTCCRRTSCNSGLPPAGLPSCIPNLTRNAPLLSLVIPATCRPPCTPNHPQSTSRSRPPKLHTKSKTQRTTPFSRLCSHTGLIKPAVFHLQTALHTKSPTTHNPLLPPGLPAHQI